MPKVLNVINVEEKVVERVVTFAPITPPDDVKTLNYKERKETFDKYVSQLDAMERGKIAEIARLDASIAKKQAEIDQVQADLDDIENALK